MAIDPITAKKVAGGIIKAVNLLNGTSQKENESKLPMILSIGLPVLLVFIFILPLMVLSSPISSFIMFVQNPSAFIDFRSAYKKIVELPVVQTEKISKYPLPCQTSKINSGYGERTHPISGKASFHTGYDFDTEWHSPVVAIAEGEVEKIGIDKDYGIYMLIKHNGFYAFYAHLSETKALPHQEVKTYDIIGYEGGDPDKDDIAGLSTGHHLHFEIRLNADAGSHTDPYPYILEPPPPEKEKDKDDAGKQPEQNTEVK
ncbi:MAG TPA: M23 family peptidase [Ruminococcaceae bacterium]|jgi:murein DD-endopeptidase MepM/ murein hydrolase activator NlpD|nr:M23 family peptidase [Oscillospiraceae bacterium]